MGDALGERDRQGERYTERDSRRERQKERGRQRECLKVGVSSSGRTTIVSYVSLHARSPSRSAEGIKYPSPDRTYTCLAPAPQSKGTKGIDCVTPAGTHARTRHARHGPNSHRLRLQSHRRRAGKKRCRMHDDAMGLSSRGVGTFPALGLGPVPAPQDRELSLLDSVTHTRRKEPRGCPEAMNSE